ncbi:MAG: dTDP-3-amino-3,4,6-trideoxy-alpha-D-glucopyranose [candidate division WS2 bacterium]|uniref:dTDP-3-amino-3,4, 6-trideoxy-alpha-D-glucopyranose n=1 Tax=Psychracetigena formicireducens TaxID=2986056 RepID=A0A9E2F744_PSYF1|nr:dTDP-3-amino-3,4,6-trideoxy-alpha-D-glucopyranose [Candidatus Psychracetigena formicireducens]MBT9151353.1 dTDP-3-amino-3,4,6-trideoxy-alpha-D-glucopyranose [Candidatus Psychracetigena formicireducens]
MKPPDIEHLYFDGRHYDQRCQGLTQDIPFWVSRARKYGDPVLELACGTGRVAIPLAKEWFLITGIDISEPMLAEARRKSSREGTVVEWIKTDIRDFELGKKFPLVIFPANTICHLLDLEDLEACLSCVKRHLTPSGRFVIEVFSPRLDILLRNPKERYSHSEYLNPDGKGTVIVTKSNAYDTASQINRIKLFYKLPE